MNLNPSEISDLIKSRIQNMELAATARNEGTVVSVTTASSAYAWPGRRDAGRNAGVPQNTFGLALNLER